MRRTLILLGIGIVGFWLLQTRNTIAGPRSKMIASDTTPSPGIVMTGNAMDRQHVHSMRPLTVKSNSGSQVYTTWQEYPGSLHGHESNIWSCGYDVGTATLCGLSEVSLAHMAVPLTPSIDLGTDDVLQAALTQREDLALPVYPWRAFYPVTCLSLHADDPLPELGVCPSIQARSQSRAHYLTRTLRRNGSQFISDFSELDSTNVGYLRYSILNVAPSATVTVDSTTTWGYVLVADPNSNRLAIIFHSDADSTTHNGVRNVAYYMSETDGEGWIDGTELGPSHRHDITEYSAPDGRQPWVHIAALFDQSGTLHVFWDELIRPGDPTSVVINHWDNATSQINTVLCGLWQNDAANGRWDLNLAKMSVGVGVLPSNLNYLYLVYTQFGGNSLAEQSDHSVAGYMNGEIYLTVSADGGQTWGEPHNLTNTHTPGCDGADPSKPCACENYASVARAVDSAIDIFYIRDFDAGSADLGEGISTTNQGLYLRLTDPMYLFPQNSSANHGCDLDGDGVAFGDNCPNDFNPSQEDLDADGVGDVCDSCTDTDADGYGDPGYPANVCAQDNCPSIANVTQADSDHDGLGDACDACPLDSLNDSDGDGVCANADNCPSAYNDTQSDFDRDAIGDACDACPADSLNDSDGDGVCANADNCPSVSNATQADSDADGKGDACDPCPLDNLNDPDGDGVCEDIDNCPGLSNPDQADANHNGIGDACDCHCDCHPNPVCDQAIVDVLDVVTTINVAFRGADPVVDPNGACPRAPTDTNCSGSTDILDVVHLINVAFRGAFAATEFCNPCP